MGIYRLFLSIMVLLSHTGLYYFGINQGVIAVIIFLIISGYTTEVTLVKKNVESLKQIKVYYLDKILRIFPLYIFWVVLTLIIVCAFHIQHETIHEVTFQGALINLLLFPLNYTPFFRVFNDTISVCDVIPAAWTLGMQMTWYLIAPILYIFSKRKNLQYVNCILLVISMSLFFLAIKGAIPGYYCYSFLPGMLWIFIVGGGYSKREKYSSFVIVFYKYVCYFIYRIHWKICFRMES